MIKVLDEHERSLAFAEVALGQIRSLRQTAVPRNYEIWYVYATGYNAPLNKIINETLARNGKLTEADLDQIYDTYLSQIKTTDRIDKVGSRVINEIDDVMSLITDALGMSASYDDSLTRRHPKAVGGAEPRPGQSGGRAACGLHPRDARHQQGAGRPADRCRSRRSPTCSRASRRSAPKA